MGSRCLKRVQHVSIREKYSNYGKHKKYRKKMQHEIVYQENFV